MKLERFLAKVFGINSGSDEKAVFGSLAAGVPDFSDNVGTIQSLDNFEQGWLQAVLGNNSPAIQDRNSLDHVLSYQIAYIMQNGVPEYNELTTYYIGHMAKKDNKVYVARVDNITGKDITNRFYWLPLEKSYSKTRSLLEKTPSSGSLSGTPVTRQVYANFDSNIVDNTKNGLYVGNVSTSIYRITASRKVVEIATYGGTSGEMAFSDGTLFVTNAAFGSRVVYHYTTDGNNFSATTGPNLDMGLHYIAAGNNKACISDGINTIFINDIAGAPQTYVSVPTPVVLNGSVSLNFANDTFYISGTRQTDGNFVIYKSTDGLTWTTFNVTDLGSDGQDFKLIVKDKTFLAVKRINYASRGAGTGLALYYFDSDGNTLLDSHTIAANDSDFNPSFSGIKVANVGDDFYVITENGSFLILGDKAYQADLSYYQGNGGTTDQDIYIFADNTNNKIFYSR